MRGVKRDYTLSQFCSVTDKIWIEKLFSMQVDTFALLNQIEQSLESLSDTTACGFSHERCYAECSLPLQNSRLGCAHPEKRILLSALQALHAIGILNDDSLRRHRENLAVLDGELFDLDDLVASWGKQSDPEQVVDAQKDVIERKDHFRQSILLFVRMKRKKLTEK